MKRHSFISGFRNLWDTRGYSGLWLKYPLTVETFAARIDGDDDPVLHVGICPVNHSSGGCVCCAGREGDRVVWSSGTGIA